MNADEFVKLNESLGHKVVRTQNHAWLFRDDMSVLSLPTLENSFPSKKELDEIFSLKAKVILFKTELAIKNCFEYVFIGNEYGIECFESKIRNQIRKGLRECTISDINKEDMIVSAFNINCQTLEKHGRKVNYLDNYAAWRDYANTLMRQEDVYIKGAWVEGELAAYAVFIKVCNKYYIYHPFMDKKFSTSCPMNALLYTFINEVLEREGEINISYGLSSYSEKSGLDKFKKAMMFTEQGCTRVVLLGWLPQLLINNITYSAIKILINSKILKPSIGPRFKYILNNKRVLREYINLFGVDKHG